MKKSIICIGAYCPDSDRVEKLVNLLNFLNRSLSKTHWISVISSYPLDKHVQGICDFCFYERENRLEKIGDGISPANTFVSAFDFTIYSSFENCYTTLIPALNKLSQGLSLSKYLQCDFFHFLEYDTDPSNIILDEILENEDLISHRGYDHVTYYMGNSKIGGFDSMRSSFKFHHLQEKFDPDLLLDECIVASKSPLRSGTAEDLTMEFSQDAGAKIFRKDYSKISSVRNTVKHKNYLVCPLYRDNKYGNYGIFLYNGGDDPMEISSIKYLIGGNIVFFRENIVLNPGHFTDFKDLFTDINELIEPNKSEIQCIVNDNLYANYDLSTEESRELFFSLNRKEYN